MVSPASLPSHLTVACLCADWCGSCRGYRADFESTVSAEAGANIEALWIDIEDEAELVGAVDVENFPTLLIARGDEVLFFGPVTPHVSTLKRLVQAALAGQSHLGGTAPDDEVRALASRLRRAPGRA
ncbi:MAG: thiol reductase thioredoxin [Burkholderiales bacterium PBB1]|nr:MAG: thiol reductase thioredoxin [Burkholderiales bacterium PBB1]